MQYIEDRIKEAENEREILGNNTTDILLDKFKFARHMLKTVIGFDENDPERPWYTTLEAMSILQVTKSIMSSLKLKGRIEHYGKNKWVKESIDAYAEELKIRRSIKQPIWELGKKTGKGRKTIYV
jgi:hypothetical protein